MVTRFYTLDMVPALFIGHRIGAVFEVDTHTGDTLISIGSGRLAVIRNHTPHEHTVIT